MEQSVTHDDAILLLQRITGGDERAVEELYRAYHERIYAFAMKRLNNSADAADVLNDVMLEVWRSAFRFEGRSRPLTWILGIANYKIIDKLRKRYKVIHEEIDPQIPDPDNIPALDAIVGVEDARQLRDCLDELSDSHRMVVHLAFFEDLSYGEIARIADCPEGTVKTRMFHAKKLLKQCLVRLDRGTDCTSTCIST